MEYDFSADAVTGLAAVVVDGEAQVLDGDEALAFLAQMRQIGACWDMPAAAQVRLALFRVTGRRLGTS